MLDLKDVPRLSGTRQTFKNFMNARKNFKILMLCLPGALMQKQTIRECWPTLQPYLAALDGICTPQAAAVRFGHVCRCSGPLNSAAFDGVCVGAAEPLWGIKAGLAGSLAKQAVSVMMRLQMQPVVPNSPIPCRACSCPTVSSPMHCLLLLLMCSPPAGGREGIRKVLLLLLPLLWSGVLLHAKGRVPWSGH